MRLPESTHELGASDSRETLDSVDWYEESFFVNSSANWTEGYRKTLGKPIFTLQIIAVTFYVIMIPLGLCSNLLIIIPYLKNASLRRVTSNFFIVHMAVVNMINICIFYPLILKNVFAGVGGSETSCLVMKVAFDIIFIVPSLFSVVCVSVNQLLLIVSPQRMYRRCCTHKAIGAVLVVFWSCQFMKAGLEMVYREVDPERRCAVKDFENEWMSHFSFFLFILFLVIPTLVIPVCHVIVLCYVKSSRKRAKGESTRRHNAATTEMDLSHSKGCTEVTDQTSSTIGKSAGKMSVMSNVSIVTTASMAPVSEVDFHHDHHFPSCSSQQTNISFDVALATEKMNRCTGRVKARDGPNSPGTGQNRNAVTELEPELKIVSKKLSISRGLSRRFSSIMLTRRASTQKPSHASQGLGKAEARLIKMMVAMYAILVAGWVTSLVSELIKNRVAYFVLFSLGGLVPLFHTLVPYIYLWGNRNYHEAIKTFFGFSRICRNRVRPN